MRISELRPGMVFADTLQGKRFVFVGRVPFHPLWTHLSMVIWREVVITKDDEEAQQSNHPLGWQAGKWFHDALDPDMELPWDQLPEPEGVRERRWLRNDHLRLMILGDKAC